MDLNFLSSFFSPVLVIKIVTLIAIFFYAFFTFIVFTQIRTMGQILDLPHVGIILKIISIINIILAISLFALAFVIL